MKKLMLLAVVLVGCGGDDGVSDSKRLSDLTQAEAQSVCEDLADDFPERSVNCMGTTITIGFNKSECAADSTEPTPATCTATVGDARDCADAFYGLTDDQICTTETLPAACAPLEEC